MGIPKVTSYISSKRKKPTWRLKTAMRASSGCIHIFDDDIKRLIEIHVS